MPHVKFTKNLQRFFPTLTDTDIDGATVAEIIHEIDQRWPGLAAYIVDERGKLRQHVNIFVGDSLIHDRETLQDRVEAKGKVFIFQALSGG